MSNNRLKKLLEAVEGVKHLLILPHNNPDPDAIASAVALKYLLEKTTNIKSRIVYKGIIGRAENKALVHYLNRPLQRLKGADLDIDQPIALVDTQPGAGNNPLPAQAKPTLVIDHHPLRQATNKANFFDVRPNVGSTASILTGYLQAAGLPIEPLLATALFYGIKTDTMGLERGVSSLDTHSFCRLLPQVDIEAMFKIERAQVPADYFKNFVTALQNACLYGEVIISYIGAMNYPDMAAEMADMLLRMQGSRWVVCIGVYHDSMILSVRTYNRRGAGQLVQQIVGARGSAGGHGAMAGGQILLRGDNPAALAQQLTQQILAYLNISPDTDPTLLI